MPVSAPRRATAALATPSLATLGWRPGVGGPARESVELVQAQRWTVARLWSTRGDLIGRPLPAGTYRAIVTVEGDATLQSRGRQHALGPRQVILLDGPDLVRTENRDLWARLEWRLRPPVPLRPLLAGCLAMPVTLSEHYFRLLTAITNVTATSHPFGADMFLEALSATLAAALSDALGIPHGLSPTRTVQYVDALRLIDEHHRDRTFSVETLRHRMSVSESTLHLVFQAAGTTPRQALESRRVATALAELDAAPDGERPDLADVARRSGFTSVRRLQSALRRQSHVAAARGPWVPAHA
ncbi:helix-turn-helix domain-containing protein [Microbacterium sp. No. 7]|uniref:helix-turn-helix domain-containing protein n=1 Tax=Microbacterium sp. No. 7 TaxID=1714373 RepID=UPI0006D2534C|nr:helix-turn-helix domain-containing protein [Microbacterium sp. No. 7]ALJ21915.1 hypothetical protein AOA12_19245 [Microbacterium sp. No. 7]